MANLELQLEENEAKRNVSMKGYLEYQKKITDLVNTGYLIRISFQNIDCKFFFILQAVVRLELDLAKSRRVFVEAVQSVIAAKKELEKAEDTSQVLEGILRPVNLFRHVKCPLFIFMFVMIITFIEADKQSEQQLQFQLSN